MRAPELVVLDRAQCLTLLRTTSTARVAYSVHGTPRIEVVNYLLDEDGGAAVIRMAAGSRSAAVGRGESFALEIDRIDEILATGWSVTAVGRVAWVSDAAEIRRLDTLLHAAAPGERPFFARITFGHIFGRRLGALLRGQTRGPSALPVRPGGAEHQDMTFIQRTDHDLKTAVFDEIAWLPSVNSDHIGVAVTAGVVTLSGRVDSYPERYRAEQAALGVRGVTAVAEEITVQGTPESDDTTIAREANHALAQAIDVPAGSVQVLVKNRVLTLNGAIPWQFQRLAAARAVRYIKGVHSIHNNVSVTPAVSPEGIKDAISSALMRDALLEGASITVNTDGSHVTLTGTVHTFAERRQAESTAWSAPGVSKVSCNLVVGA